MQTQEILCRAAADLLGDKEDEQDADEQQKREPDAVVEHDEQDAEDDDRRADQRGDRLCDELTERIDVVGVIAHDVAVLVGVKILDRKILHLLEHRAAHLAEKALRDIRHELGVQRDRHKRDGVHAHEEEDLRQNFGFCQLPVAADLPKLDHFGHALQEYGGDRRGDRREDDTNDGDGDQRGVKTEEHFEQTSQNALFQARLAHWLITPRHRFHLRSFVAHRPHGRSRCSQAALRACPSR